MEIAKLTSKGQITIPADVRRKLGLRMGSKVIFVERENSFLMVNASHARLALSEDQVVNAKANGWTEENIRSWGSIDDPTFTETPDLSWTSREDFD